MNFEAIIEDLESPIVTFHWVLLTLAREQPECCIWDLQYSLSIPCFSKGREKLTWTLSKQKFEWNRKGLTLIISERAVWLTYSFLSWIHGITCSWMIWKHRYLFSTWYCLRKLLKIVLPFPHEDGQSSMLISHRIPMKPDWQVHLKLFTRSEQLPKLKVRGDWIRW